MTTINTTALNKKASDYSEAFFSAISIFILALVRVINGAQEIGALLVPPGIGTLTVRIPKQSSRKNCLMLKSLALSCTFYSIQTCF